MTTHPPQIDTQYLLRQINTLQKVKERKQTWNQLGERLARIKQWPPLPIHLMDRLPVDPEAAMTWNLAKALVYEAITSPNPKYNAIRRRLGDLSQPSTPRLMNTLGLWLAGIMGIPVSNTLPMVGTMLYAVANSGKEWDVLYK